MRQSCRQYQREEDRDDGKSYRLPQPGGNFALEKHSGNAQPDAAERLFIQQQRYAHIVDGGRFVDHTQLSTEFGVLHNPEVRAFEDRLADQFGVGSVEDGFAVDVHDGCVINHWPIGHCRFQHGVQIEVGRQIIGKREPELRGVAGINVGAGEVRGLAVCDVSELCAQVVRRVALIRNPQPQYLGNINIGKPAHQRCHHKGNGEHDLGFSPHTSVSPNSKTPGYSSLANAASAAALPYSLSLLCRVFRLMPRISAARVLLLLVDSMVFRISRLSASSTVVPTPRWIASGSSDEVRIVAWPKPGGRCLVSTTAPSQTITARSKVFRSSRTFPGHE